MKRTRGSKHFDGDFDAFMAQFELHHAAQDGSLDQVKNLIAQGRDVNLFDELSLTPLHHAVEAGHLEVAQYLLDHGADIDAHDEAMAGNTPLANVAGECPPRVARFLIEAGADPLIPGWMRLTALDRAQDRKDEDGERILKLLLDAARRRKRSNP